MLQVQELSKSFGQKLVVDGVSLEIHKNKITSFIGPNGAGKSTVFNLISRLIMRDEGHIGLDEVDISNWKSNELSKRIAILKQNNSLQLKLTVRELVAFGRFPHSQGRLNEEDETKIDEALSYMELEEFSDKFIDELSGGQRQRAYIAMVIAQDTDYILLDEPLNNLDIKHAMNFMKMIQKLCYELNKTVIIVMHDINFASCYSDYIVAFKEGQIIASGSTEDIMKEHILEEIYEIPFAIHELNGKKICVYY